MEGPAPESNPRLMGQKRLMGQNASLCPNAARYPLCLSRLTAFENFCASEIRRESGTRERLAPRATRRPGQPRLGVLLRAGRQFGPDVARRRRDCRVQRTHARHKFPGKPDSRCSARISPMPSFEGVVRVAPARTGLAAPTARGAAQALPIPQNVCGISLAFPWESGFLRNY